MSASRGCLVCGTENPISLGARFDRTETGVQSRVVPGANFQGIDGVLHGGIVAGLLDDAMWYAAFAAGLITVTAEISVRYKHSAPVEKPLVVRASVQSKHRILCVCTAELRDETGKLFATAKGKFVQAPEKIREAMLNSVSPEDSSLHKPTVSQQQH